MYELYCEVRGNRENNKYWDILLYENGDCIVDESFYNKNDCDKKISELENKYNISCEYV